MRALRRRVVVGQVAIEVQARAPGGVPEPGAEQAERHVLLRRAGQRDVDLELRLVERDRVRAARRGAARAGPTPPRPSPRSPSAADRRSRSGTRRTPRTATSRAMRFSNDRPASSEFGMTRMPLLVSRCVARQFMAITRPLPCEVRIQSPISNGCSNSRNRPDSTEPTAFCSARPMTIDPMPSAVNRPPTSASQIQPNSTARLTAMISSARDVDEDRRAAGCARCPASRSRRSPGSGR